MRNLIMTILVASVGFIGMISPIQAQMATMNEVETVAENWVNLIIEKRGDWGGSTTAYVSGIEEFKHGEKVIGYFCHVSPRGFIVVSLRRELAPVKAYSSTACLDPESNLGIAVILKTSMGGIIEAIETRIGPIQSVRTSDLESILDIRYGDAWDQLAAGDFHRLDYQEGEVLLSSAWHQQPPYNDDCPDEGCDWDYYGDYNSNTLVGCTATAGAQIMRYWSWPPYGQDSPYNDYYDWPNILDQYIYDTLELRFEDEHGDTVTQAQIDAVAELCHEAGEAAGMWYNCDWSYAEPCDDFFGRDMLDGFEDHFRYDTDAECLPRGMIPPDVWFSYIQFDINKNRPILYLIQTDWLPDHVIVCDGWREIGRTKQYHMNFGWGPDAECDCPDGSTQLCNYWHTLDEICESQGTPSQMMVIYLRPKNALGSSFSGTYSPPSFPYRYFDQDAESNGATFQPGHNLQFLPGVTVTCTSTSGGSIDFQGTSANNTLLFSRGDQSKGIRIHGSGQVSLYQHGSIKFR
ncbi:MAG: C10 family peptidase [Candidatus Zixiibacteriota bacterium]|nr:MAG: C10 family peptidase [candidate division Zixibacteria bacterium]